MNNQFSNSNSNNLMNFIQQIKNCANPQQMLQQAVMNNPQFGIIRLLQENGGNAKKAFMSLAAQKGVNPNDIINLLRQ